MNKYDRSQDDRTSSRSALWLSLVTIIFFVMACSSGSVTPTRPVVRVTLPPSSTQAIQSTSITTLVSATASQTREETFYDSFDTANGWSEEDTERYSMGRMEDGIYQMSFWQAGDSDYLISFQPHQFILPIRNTTLRVWGTALNGDGAYGLVCRYKDANNLYTFHISTDGRYWLYKRVNGAWTNLGSGTDPVIGEENTLEFLCNGDHIQASVNGAIIAEASDTSLTEGLAGLFAQPLGGQVVGAWSYYAIFDSFEMTILP